MIPSGQPKLILRKPKLIISEQLKSTLSGQLKLISQDNQNWSSQDNQNRPSQDNKNWPPSGQPKLILSGQPKNSPSPCLIQKSHIGFYIPAHQPPFHNTPPHPTPPPSTLFCFSQKSTFLIYLTSCWDATPPLWRGSLPSSLSPPRSQEVHRIFRQVHCTLVICRLQWVTVADLHSTFLNVHRSGVLTALFGCYMAGATWNCCRLGICFTYTIRGNAPVYSVILAYALHTPYVVMHQFTVSSWHMLYIHHTW